MTTDIFQPVTPRKWYEIWWDVWTHPGVAAFERILKEPNKTPTRGFIWVAVTSLVVVLFNYLFSALLLQNLMADAFGDTVLDNYGNTTLYYICGIILTPIFAIIGITISAGIYHWVAKLFGGQGNWSDLLFCLSAVTAPGTLIGGVMGIILLLFVNSPILIFLPSLVILAYAIYMVMLNVNAIRAGENIGTMQALGTIVLPMFIVGVLVACCTLILLIPAFSTVVSGQ